MSKLHIKKGDIVFVNTGEDKGKTGRVLEVLVKANRAIVEGINMVSKHTKPNAKNPQGGIEKKEAPIHISNVAYLDPVKKQPTRIHYEYELDENGNVKKDAKGNKIKYRVAVLSGTRIDK